MMYVKVPPSPPSGQNLLPRKLTRQYLPTRL